jgi:hypothetical protein
MRNQIKMGDRVVVPSDETIKTEPLFDNERGADQNFVIMEGNSIETRQLAVSNLAMDALDLAYEVNGKAFRNKDSIINGGRLADTHWQMLTVSHDDQATHQYGYKAVAFINRHTHEIHIASAGTVLNYHDIRDDILLAFGKVPYKLQPLKIFVDRVVQEVGGAAVAKAYQFSTSGHSLGAVVADLTGLEIASRGLSLVSSTTFENPGSAAAIQAVLDKKGFSGELDSDHLAKIKHICIVYNAKPNLINTTQPQFGQCYLLQPKREEPSQVSTNDSLFAFVKHLAGIVGGGLAVNAFKEYLGFNKLIRFFKDLKRDHALQNFQDWDKQRKIEVVQWPSGWDRKASLYGKPLSAAPLKELPTSSSSRQEIIIKQDNTPSYVRVLGEYFRDLLGVSVYLQRWLGGTQVNRSVDLGDKSDVASCHELIVDKARIPVKFQGSKLYSAAALEEHISTFNQDDLNIKQGSIHSSCWYDSYHSYPPAIACC